MSNKLNSFQKKLKYTRKTEQPFDFHFILAPTPAQPLFQRPVLPAPQPNTMPVCPDYFCVLFSFFKTDFSLISLFEVGPCDRRTQLFP